MAPARNRPRPQSGSRIGSTSVASGPNGTIDPSSFGQAHRLAFSQPVLHTVGMAKKKRLAWRQFHILVRGLAERVESAGFRPDVLVGVTRGGLVPLALLGELMGMKNVATISSRSYDGVERGKLNISALPDIDLRGKRVLLVDEITDSGEA